MIRTRDLQLRRADQFHKFLKPGALARIRDSRISARSHRLSSLCQISLCPNSPPSSSRSTDGQPQINVAEGSPLFAGRTYGPRCPQRKKLVASKYVLSVAAAPSNLTLNLPDLITDSFNNDVVVTN
ncbi:uncharacterized protein LOC114762970 [Neltuma alba]|uniref:uncharacterized protein LOC114711535 n=1 Tax=Neltuma alba TaxID=207710 RepID=UPI0010A39651|nr:uncharacterized protein LOC114711535 [Prosopis alba]XP_028808401.1 uncharacterized protein LOC114762970 [Prosopis alba]